MIITSCGGLKNDTEQENWQIVTCGSYSVVCNLWSANTEKTIKAVSIPDYSPTCTAVCVESSKYECVTLKSQM